ncbi:MAG: winged helix DNA-binding domain-containing protein [Candidatus Limnocylindrales bacterium]
MRLTDRRLNRATLARQLLLERALLDPVTAVEAVGGLQAQEPASPYLALWTRLRDYRPDDVTRALHARELVKASLGRSTLHLVSAAEYRSSVTALLAVTRSRWMQERRGLPVHRSLPELAEASLAFASEPRTNVELRDHAGTLGEPVAADELWRRIRRYGAFVHVPGDEPWGFGRRPVQVAARAWLPRPESDEAASLEHLVRTHLRAFGPARLADMAQWSGLATGILRRGLERVGDVVTHEDEHGRELYDLPGAPLPDEDEPAPPRLLPMWDELLLAYADRGRVLPEAYRKRVIVKAGDVLPTFMIDGYVAGLWWAEAGDGDVPRIVLEPFRRLTPSEHEALEAEAEALAGLIAPREPEVYRRYRHTRRRA